MHQGLFLTIVTIVTLMIIIFGMVVIEVRDARRCSDDNVSCILGFRITSH